MTNLMRSVILSFHQRKNEKTFFFWNKPFAVEADINKTPFKESRAMCHSFCYCFLMPSSVKPDIFFHVFAY